MDAPAFASLAQVRILLLPVGAIRQSTFDKWAAEIRAFEEIRLGDIPAHTRDDRARFMPNPLSSGHLHLSFPTHPPPTSHAQLSVFRPSYFPLGVIGIADCSQTQTLSSNLAQFNAMVSDMFPPGSAYPLAQNCFGFEESDGNANFNIVDNLPGLVLIPSVMGNKKLYIGTLLAELCSNILGEFSVMVKTLESPLGCENLNATLFPGPLHSPDLRSSLDAGESRDSLPPLPSQHSILSNGSSRAKSPPAALPLKRTSAPGPGVNGNSNPPTRAVSLGVQPPKKRQSTLGSQTPHGRLYKVLGDLFLLSGRTMDAVIWYNEAIALFKGSQDLVWHAAALEGIATVGVLEAWAAGHGLNSSITPRTEPWAEHAEKLVQAISLYSKATPLPDNKEHYSYMAFLYVSAVLRHASLLFSIWSAKGWGPLAFTTMLHPGPHPYLPPTINSLAIQSVVYLDRMSSISGISRSQISLVLAQVHGPWLLHLGQREQIAVLEATAGMYSCLGYRRKEAYILREILGCVMDLIVCGREEAGASRAAETDGIGLGINGAGFSEARLDGRGHVGIRETEDTAGNSSILQLVKYVCKTHGVDLDAVRFHQRRAQAGPGGTPEWDPTEQESGDLLVETPGWTELQVGIVREALAVAEALPDYSAVALFTLSALKTLHPVLEPDDQYHLHTAAARALATARRRGLERCVEYWSGNPVVSIEAIPLPFIRIPVERPMSELYPPKGDVATLLTSKIDPFLYNPRRLAADKRKVLVVQKELLDFIVTLQNPFCFALELHSVSLSTSGTPFESHGIPVVVPANSYQQLTLSGRALQAGTLVILGCAVQAVGGAPREFVLPLLNDEEEEQQSRRRSTLACEIERVKFSGLHARLQSQKRVSGAPLGNKAPAAVNPSQFLELRVVPEQPLLRIRRTSLTHGAVMLYNGETSTIRLTLENVSALPVDFLKLTFDDSSRAPLEQALADGDLSVFEKYETEHELIRRAVFFWDVNDHVNEILPGKEVVVNITCRGKVGCSNGMIQISYAHTHPHQATLQKPPEVFYTRQLLYPILVTVYHMLECHAMDVIPHSRVETVLAGLSDESERRRNLLTLDDPGWCLFTIDVRNTYGLPFEVIFDRASDGNVHQASTAQIIPPGSTYRFIVPIKRFMLPESSAAAPVPVLSDKQYVVSKSTLSSSEEKTQRELFWYREKLFQLITGRWREASGTRAGDISLRDQRLTLPMLHALRTETVQVELSIHDGEAGVESGTRKVRYHGTIGTRFVVTPNEFLCLRARVTNLSPSPLVLSLSLDINPMEHVVHAGILVDIPVGCLDSGMSQDVDTMLCFVAQGRFDISAHVRLVGTELHDTIFGTSNVRAIVREGLGE